MVRSTLSSLVTGWSTVIKSLRDEHKKESKRVKACWRERERGINITQTLQRERERDWKEIFKAQKEERDKERKEGEL